jgi:hypothetical protein
MSERDRVKLQTVTFHIMPTYKNRCYGRYGQYFFKYYAQKQCETIFTIHKPLYNSVFFLKMPFYVFYVFLST